MKWSPEQDNALLKAQSWYSDKSSEKQVFRLFGYAGTGKTTLAKYLAENISGVVLFGAFTGKAAHVLQQKGCPDARTIHSLIYNTRDKSKKQLIELEKQLEQLTKELTAEKLSPEEIGRHIRIKDLSNMIRIEKDNMDRPYFALNPESDVKDADLVIIDECSMVSEQMGLDLLSFGTKILVLGDPAQLPPIGSAGFFTENVTPDIMLSDIRRQAGESPIIHLATMLRNHELPSFGQYGESKWIRSYDLDPKDVLDVDQLLVGRNKTRTLSNKRIRFLNGKTDLLPVLDDKLVCLQNHHEEGLLNGALYEVVEMIDLIDNKILMSIKGEDGETQEVLAHDAYFMGTSDDLKWFEKREAKLFDYGYALTVHKAQGSQWDNVMLFDESNTFRNDKWRWLYTGVTRAAEKITIVERN